MNSSSPDFLYVLIQQLHTLSNWSLHDHRLLGLLPDDWLNMLCSFSKLHIWVQMSKVRVCHVGRPSTNYQTSTFTMHDTDKLRTTEVSAHIISSLCCLFYLCHQLLLLQFQKCMWQSAHFYNLLNTVRPNSRNPAAEYLVMSASFPTFFGN